MDQKSSTERVRALASHAKMIEPPSPFEQAFLLLASKISVQKIAPFAQLVLRSSPGFSTSAARLRGDRRRRQR
jgi:hypothetical protein